MYPFFMFINKRIYNWIATSALSSILNASNMDTPKSSSDQPAKLICGEDYYLEDGRYVFTAKYHLKRGYCCGNKCRHCPYPALNSA